MFTAFYPGDSAQTISGTVTNNAANSAYVNTVTVSISGVTGGAGSCDATDYTLADPVMTVAADVAAAACRELQRRDLAVQQQGHQPGRLQGRDGQPRLRQQLVPPRVPGTGRGVSPGP